MSRALYESLRDLIASLPVPAEKEALARALGNARSLLQAVKSHEAEVEAALAACLGKDLFVVEGVGAFQRKGSVTRKAWDSQSLFGTVASRAVNMREPDADGCITAPEAVVLDSLQKCVGVSYWRVGALRDLGIDPDEYCSVEYGPPRVTIT